MIITRSLLEDGNIYPDIYNLLDTIKDNDMLLHHKEYLQIHPMAMYNKSILRLFSSINNLIDFMENQSDVKKYSNNDELFIRTKEIIESLIAFKDDTFQIMKCLYPKSACTRKKERHFADKWLEDVNPKIIKEYKDYLEFISNINTINNQIKHNNGRLSFFQVNAMSYFFVMGFFLESVDESGTKIPNDSVHPRYKKMHTGYSYNYFIPLAFSFLYMISYHACVAIKSIIKDFYGEEIVISRSQNKCEDVIELINKINKFTTKIIFPDEYEREFSQVTYINEELKIEYPSEVSFKKNFLNYNEHKIHLITSGDWFTKSYQIPYW